MSDKESGVTSKEVATADSETQSGASNVPQSSNIDSNDEKTLPQEQSAPTTPSWSMTDWFNSAKQKTMETAALMKKDLNELKDVMAVEVSELTTAAKGSLGTTVNVVKQQVQQLVSQESEENGEDAEVAPAEEKIVEEGRESPDILSKVEKSASMGFGWMKSIVGAVTDTVKNLAVEETYKDEEEFTEVIKCGVARNTRLSKLVLSKLQSDDSTYLSDPVDANSFGEWREKFSMAEHDGEVNILLAQNPAMRAKFSELVPSVIDYSTFWTRYFYAVYMAELDAQMKETLSKDAIDTKENVVNEQPTSPSHSTDDWSICSEKNDVEELASTQSDGSGAGTPQPPELNDKKDNGWVDWDD